ncbi:hypothetical protein [Pseudanabaena sp. Chao 1811]|nr:hypothetical protein [Pseudanabaena sp. Chao 1811]
MLRCVGIKNGKAIFNPKENWDKSRLSDQFLIFVTKKTNMLFCAWVNDRR